MDPFIYIHTLNVVVCKICHYGCVAEEIERHLAAEDHLVRSIDERKRIAYTIQSIPGIIQSQADLKRWQPPSPFNAEVPYLLPAKGDRFGCNECPAAYSHVKKIQQHYREQHGWKSPEKRGRQARYIVPAAVPWRTGVHCQRLFRNRCASGWFEVNRPLCAAASTGGTESSPDASAAEETTEEKVLRISTQRWQILQQPNRVVQASGDKTEANEWLDRTGWSGHLQELEHDKLLAMVGPIQDHEEVLQVVCEGCERSMDQAQFIAMPHRVGLSVLFEVNRNEAKSRGSRPFNSRMVDKAWTKYKKAMMTLVRYAIRTQPMAEDDRPPYQPTERQEDLIQQVTEMAASTRLEDKLARSRFDRLCLDMMVSWFDHDIKDSHFANVVISGLAVIGRREDGGWRQAADFTPVLSAVIKIARMLVVSQAYHERQELVEVYRRECHMSRREAQETADSLYKIVREKVRRFIVKPNDKTWPSPMDWLYETRTYGMKIRYTTPAEGTVDWQGDRISYQSVQFDMNQLCDMVTGLVDETRRVLSELLMVHDDTWSEIPQIPWQQIKDDHREDRVGYSFLKDDRNDWAAHGETWLMQRMVMDEARREDWIEGGPQPTFRSTAARSYKRQLDDFRERLLVLMHMCGGQPARGSEILGLRLQNTSHGGVRNVFIDDGLVSFVTTYHKGYQHTGHVKVIHRFLPREVGELLVWYMWLVVPFWQQVEGEMRQADQASAFLWAQNMVHREDEDTDSIEDAGEAELADQEAAELEGEEAVPQLSRQQKRDMCAQWGSDHMRRALQNHTERLMGTPVNIMAWRNMAIAISRRYLDSQFGDQDQWDEDNDDDAEDSVWDLQAGHGTHIAGMIYARLLSEGNFGTASMRTRFRQVSIKWHRFLTLGDRDDVAASGKRKREAFDEGREQARFRRFKRLCNTDIHGMFRQMMGKDVRFRGNQEAVIRAIIRGESPIVQVVGTGGGKSLSFMLPAFCDGTGVTIVITPLVALENDMIQRCSDLHIDSHMWQGRGPNRAAPIVFVTPESASTQEFRTFINRLHSRQQLDRMVFDESHMVLDAVKGFRPRLREIGKVMAEAGVQLVCLTATLAPRDEAEFFRVMQIPAGRVRMFREATTRPNIHYRIHDIGSEGDIDEAVKEEVRRYLAVMPTGRIIVYGGTVDRVKRLGDMLQCPVYFSKVGTPEQKRQIMADWLTRERTVIATNALGVGIDIPDVRVVIHAGTPRQLRDYAQESGRAGRDGSRSESVIITRLSTHRSKSRSREMRRRRQWVDPVKADMTEFVEGRHCRRIVLDAVIDGRQDRVGCEEGEEPCDYCSTTRRPDDIWPVQHIDSGFHEPTSDRREDVTEKGSNSEDIVSPWSSSPQAETQRDGFVSTINSDGPHISNVDIPSWSSSPLLQRDRRRVQRQERINTTPSSTQQIWSSSPPIGRQAVQSSEDSPSSNTLEEIFEMTRRDRAWEALQRRRTVQREAEEITEFIHFLEQWRDVCIRCRLAGKGLMRHRQASDCDEDVEDEKWGDFTVAKQTMQTQVFDKRRLENYSGCFECGLPYELCDRWIAAEGDGGRFRRCRTSGRCVDDGLLSSVIALVARIYTDEMETVWEEMQEKEGAKATEVYMWLGKQVRWGGLQTSNLCRFFWRACQVHRDQWQ